MTLQGLLFAVDESLIVKSFRITYIDLISTLLAATLLGLFCTAVYRLTHRGLNYERAFLFTLVMICPIVGVVMMLIGSNLALSFGMIGALSIIRFRTVIKDSRDTIFLFWGIAIGLGCGTSNIVAITIASLIIGVLIVVFDFAKLGQRLSSDYVFVVRGEDERPVNEIQQIFQSHKMVAVVRSIDSTQKNWEMVYDVRFPPESQDESRVVSALNELQPVTDVSLLAPQLTLPV